MLARSRKTCLNMSAFAPKACRMKDFTGVMCVTTRTVLPSYRSCSFSLVRLTRRCSAVRDSPPGGALFGEACHLSNAAASFAAASSRVSASKSPNAISRKPSSVVTSSPILPAEMRAVACARACGEATMASMGPYASSTPAARRAWSRPVSVSSGSDVPEKRRSAECCVCPWRSRMNRVRGASVPAQCAGLAVWCDCFSAPFGFSAAAFSPTHTPVPSTMPGSSPRAAASMATFDSSSAFLFLARGTQA